MTQLTLACVHLSLSVHLAGIADLSSFQETLMPQYKCESMRSFAIEPFLACLVIILFTSKSICITYTTTCPSHESRMGGTHHMKATNCFWGLRLVDPGREGTGDVRQSSNKPPPVASTNHKVISHRKFVQNLAHPEC